MFLILCPWQKKKKKQKNISQSPFESAKAAQYLQPIRVAHMGPKGLTPLLVGSGRGRGIVKMQESYCTQHLCLQSSWISSLLGWSKPRSIGSAVGRKFAVPIDFFASFL